jgi:Lactonase, 7-bladed beta-propeller
MRYSRGWSVWVLAIMSASAAAQPDTATLFVGNNISDTVSVFTVLPDGALAEITGSPFPAGEDVQALALTDDGTKLVVTNAGESVNTEDILLFNVGAGGDLAPVPQSPFVTGDAPLGLDISSRGFVYSPSAFLDELWVFRIEGDELVELPGSPWSTPFFPNEVAATPDGAFVYTSQLFGGISGWRVESDGNLSLLPGSPFDTPGDGFELLVSPDGRHLYLALGLTHDIAGYSIEANGVLTPLPGSPFPSGGSSSVNLAMSPSGEFLFVVHVVSETVTTMARAADGSLAFVQGSSQFIGSDARKAAASDEFLFVTDDSSFSPGVGVMAYRIGETGLLDLVPGSPFAAGGRPQDMVLYLPPAGVFGDGDADGDVDIDDYEIFLRCVTGSDAGPIDAGCATFDSEPDDDIDFHDLGALQLAFGLAP